MRVYSACGGRKRLLDPLEPDVLACEPLDMGPGYPTHVPCKLSSLVRMCAHFKPSRGCSHPWTVIF